MDDALHSLWLLFHDDVTGALKTHIDDLASMLGGPSFEPHVTLAPDMGIGNIRHFEERALRCASDSRAAAGFGRIMFGESFFQSVYFSLSLPEPLSDLRREAFSLRGTPPAFPPHVSLAYGATMTPDARRAIDAIENEFAGKTLPLASVAVAGSSEDRPVDAWRVIRTTRFPHIHAT